MGESERVVLLYEYDDGKCVYRTEMTIEVTPNGLKVGDVTRLVKEFVATIFPYVTNEYYLEE